MADRGERLISSLQEKLRSRPSCAAVARVENGSAALKATVDQLTEALPIRQRAL